MTPATNSVQHRNFFLVASALLIGALIRLWWASTLPLANDEAYYWDWGRALQLSYFDHPPGVSWLAVLSQTLMQALSPSLVWPGGIPPPALAARCVVPITHLLACICVFTTARLLKGASLVRREMAFILVATQLAPGLSLGGVILLPDAGLIPAITLLALWAVWRSQLKHPLTAVDGLIFGVLSGVGLLFKYHALPIGAGLALGLFWVRRRDGLRALSLFTAASTIALLLVASPILLWNIQHNWISFRYQSDHGFGGYQPAILPFARAVFGVLLFATPVIIATTIIAASKGLRSSRSNHVQEHLSPISWSASFVLACGFWLLFSIITVAALGKQILPHWVMPAFWIALPLAAVYFGRNSHRATLGKAFVTNAVVFGFITLVIPTMFSSKQVRASLLAAFAGKPGPLAELTLWPQLAQAIVSDPRITAARAVIAQEKATNTSCQTLPEIVSARWFWTAQLAFHLPGQPKVGSLEPKMSYYRFRDNSLSAAANCKALLIADARHIDHSDFHAAASLISPFSLKVEAHDDVPVIVAIAQIHAWPRLQSAQTRHPGLKSSPGLKSLDANHQLASLGSSQ